MTEKERLIKVQEELKQQGVKDVKFFLRSDHGKTNNEVYSAVSTFLEAVAKRKTTPRKSFEDGGELNSGK